MPQESPVAVQCVGQCVLPLDYVRIKVLLVVVIGLLGRDDDLNTIRERDDFKEFETLIRVSAKPPKTEE